MDNNEKGRNLGHMIAQDAKIIARADGYGPMPSQQVKTRPPAPAPMVKPQSTIQPVTVKSPKE